MKKLNIKLSEIGEVTQEGEATYLKIHPDVAVELFYGKAGVYMDTIVWDDKHGYGESVQISQSVEQREEDVKARYIGNIKESSKPE